MKKAALIIFCLITLFSFKSNLYAKTLHAILVADTVHDIRFASMTDLARWHKEINVIAKHTNMALKEKVFRDCEFRSNHLASYLKNLQVAPDDTVVFYFSGHGYRTEDKKTRWPFLTFELYKPGLDLQWIVDTIREKKPKFALVLADCCNNYVERDYNNAGRDIRVDLRNWMPCYEGYERLFSDAKGCVVIASSSEGQFSYGSVHGGLYTQCFFTSLNHEIASQSPSWKQLLQRAYNYISRVQNPIVQVHQWN